VLFLSYVEVLDPLRRFHPDFRPAERLAIERIQVTERGFAAKVRAESPEPVTIAQLQIDGAFWVFSQEPTGPLTRAETAWVRVDFPWVAGETHQLRLITGTGVVVEDTVEVALPSPSPSWRLLVDYTLLGICVGFAPVALGMLFFPIVRTLPGAGLEFLLSLTIGLLVYLWVDMTLEGLTFADRSSAIFRSGTLVWIPMALTFAALAAMSGSSSKEATGARVAVLVALGVGLHNLGEGLAIGAALAHNEISLGAFLVAGFALHNLTEGVGVVAPLARERGSWVLLAGLALLAGLPAVPGIWAGAFFLSPHWAAIFFGIGAGAVAQVVVEIDRFMNARVRGKSGTRFSSASVAGYGAGAAIMYATALLVAA